MTSGAPNYGGQTATLLADGRVFVTDLDYPDENTAEFFDPGTGTWTMTSQPGPETWNRIATLLHDGRILVTGGQEMAGVEPRASNSCSIFDPVTETWTATSDLNLGRYNHTVTLLPNGFVLVAGRVATELVHGHYSYFSSGRIETSEPTADPVNWSWTETSETLNEARHKHTATLLSDGQVLVAGGTPSFSGGGGFPFVEIFDPATEVWTMTADLNVPRSEHTATMLLDGRVLVAGGSGSPASFELFDPTTEIWTMPPEILNADRSGHTATMLPDGRVMVVSGDTSETFDP